MKQLIVLLASFYASINSTSKLLHNFLPSMVSFGDAIKSASCLTCSQSCAYPCCVQLEETFFTVALQAAADAWILSYIQVTSLYKI